MADPSVRKPPRLIRTDADIPDYFKSAEEEVEFWETHGFSREFLRSRRLIPSDQGPVARMKAKQAEQGSGARE